MRSAIMINGLTPRGDPRDSAVPACEIANDAKANRMKIQDITIPLKPITEKIIRRQQKSVQQPTKPGTSGKKLGVMNCSVSQREMGTGKSSAS
ncbi:hypothetical protein ACH5RR_002811 [Cinchona calisaya]|uniref:Uncharacterized protein n=1 Tax=Cinchona calisaya TaxID=153742 RepID=A0ABD3AT37_9GENT